MDKTFTGKKGMTQWTGLEPPKLLAVAVQLPDQTDEQVTASLDELAELVRTAGGRVVGRVVQKRERHDRNSYLGSGKMREVGEAAKAANAVQVIADDELTGLQIRRMEEGTGFPVIDRTRVILEIFAMHSTTREGNLQVELAQVQYVLLRLAGGYEGFSRQRGGIGTKGPGETQIETDRRVLKARVKRLHDELAQVVRTRELQRRKRAERFAPLFSLVGYTNAGKSTLLNALSGSRVVTNDGLFTTLDPTARLVQMPSGRSGILSDTVGFIRKLPHGLVKAFRATLESVLQSQVIVLVADVSHPGVRDHIAAVEEVLREIGALTIERLMVFNKIDLVPERSFEGLASAFPDALFVSARTGAGLDRLRSRMDEILGRQFAEVVLEIPAQDPILRDILALGPPLEQHWEEGKVRLRAALPRLFLPRVRRFLAAS